MNNLKFSFNSQELKHFWNKYQASYSANMERNMFSILINLCNLSNITKRIQKSDTPCKILETSCGSGLGIKYINDLANLSVTNSHPGVNIYGTDISPQMLDTAWDYLKESTNVCYKNDAQLREFNSVSNNTAKQVNIQLLECDNEKLVFDDKTFEIILSNFSLNIVNNPDAMLQETRRTLTDNGVACFSMWGRPEKSPAFTIVPNTFKKFKIELPNMRSYFHLAKIEKLGPLLERNGFAYNYCYSFVPFNTYSGDEFLHILDSPVYKGIMDTLDDTQKEEVLKDVVKEIDQLIENKTILGTEALIVVCKKI